MFKKHIQLEYYDPNDREKWLQLRRKYTGLDRHDHFAVGGSEIATIMDMNQYESSLEFFYRACGLALPKKVSNLAVLRGIAFEYNIYNKFFRFFNPDEWNVWNDEEHQERFIENASNETTVYRTANRCNAVVVNPKYPHLFINYDFILNKSKWNDRGPLEIKSQMGAAMDKWEQGVNPAYRVQVEGQMLVGEFNYGELFVLRNNEIPVLFPIEQQQDLTEKIIETSNDWAIRVIEVKTLIHEGAPQDEIDEAVMTNEPDAIGSEAWINFLKEEHKPDNQFEVEAPEGFLDNVIAYLEANEAIKAKGEDKLLPEVEIRKFCKDTGATKVILPHGLGHVSYFKKLSISPKILKDYKELMQ